jgi:ABC-type uncharacterized transport system substrate-binding protein
VLVAIATLGLETQASAHPDIRIENRVTFIFADALVTAIEQLWRFDAGYSRTLLDDYDADHDGLLSAAESRAIAAAILPNLAEVRYFTYVWLDGRDLGTLQPQDFSATVEAGRVTFRFVVPLPRPVEPTRQALRVEIYDRDYYAGIRLAEKDPVRFQNPRGIVCEARIRDDRANAYFGYVYPQEITPWCR